MCKKLTIVNVRIYSCNEFACSDQTGSGLKQCYLTKLAVRYNKVWCISILGIMS